MTATDMAKITINLVVIYLIGGLILAMVYGVTSPIMYRKAKEEKEAALKTMMPEADYIEAPCRTLTEKSLNNLRNEIIEKLKGLQDKEYSTEEVFLKNIRDILGKERADTHKDLIMKHVKKSCEWEPHHKHAEYFIAKKGEEEIGYVVEGYGKGYSSYINVYVAVDKNFIVKKIKILSHKETPGLGDEIERDYFLDQFGGKNVDNLVVVKEETEDRIEAITGATISSRAVAEDGAKKGVEMLIEKFSGDVKG